MCASGSRESRPVPSRARPRQRAVRPPATFSRQLLQSFRRDQVGSRAVPRLLSAVNTESSLARPSNRNSGTLISPTITTPQRRLVTPGFMQFHFGAPVARGPPPPSCSPQSLGLLSNTACMLRAADGRTGAFLIAPSASVRHYRRTTGEASLALEDRPFEVPGDAAHVQIHQITARWRHGKICLDSLEGSLSLPVTALEGYLCRVSARTWLSHRPRRRALDLLRPRPSEVRHARPAHGSMRCLGVQNLGKVWGSLSQIDQQGWNLRRPLKFGG